MCDALECGVHKLSTRDSDIYYCAGTIPVIRIHGCQWAGLLIVLISEPKPQIRSAVCV